MFSNHLIYLASPYSHEDPLIREERFAETCKAAGYLMQKGLHVYSPIAHCHPIAIRSELPKDFGYWQYLCTLMLARCQHIIILTLPGWRQSVGVAAEAREALKTMSLDYMPWPNYQGWLPYQRITEVESERIPSNP